jgi:hypothetical protein
VSATDPEAAGETRTRWPRALALLLALGLSCVGCAEQPLPDQGVRRDDCLREVTLADLQERIKRCDQVVATYPKDPAPLNDRYLLHSLAGHDQAACADLLRAVRLAQSVPRAQLDPQLRSDLEVRQQLCSAAPAGAGPAGSSNPKRPGP